MSFGLKNVGAIFQRMVNKVFKDLIGSTDHLQHLDKAFNLLRQYKVKLNPEKCTFGVASGKFLGYLVTQRGIKADPD